MKGMRQLSRRVQHDISNNYVMDCMYRTYSSTKKCIQNYTTTPDIDFWPSI